MPQLNAISPAQLFQRIGLDAPVIIDVRICEDFDANPQVLPSAIRRDFIDAEKIADEFRGQKVIVYCHKGLKLSQGLAARLRHAGLECEFLEGGIVAWNAQKFPLIEFAKIPLNENGTSLWVTRHRPKIDRIACPWLIRRFIDPSAEILYVEPSQVLLVAERFGATAFDVEGAKIGHTGDNTSFDALLAEFELGEVEALARMASVIRGADTARHDLDPQSAGLHAISIGLARKYRDDLAQLKAGLEIYDALYLWARDGHNEVHQHD